MLTFAGRPRPVFTYDHLMRPALLTSISLAALLVVITTGAFAQQMDLDRVVPPLESNPRTFEDYLVQQAWSNDPERRELEGEVAVADAQTVLAQRSWMEQIGANVGFSSRRDTIQFLEGRNQYLFPGYNYGLSMNIGALTNNKSRVRLAEARALVARTKVDRAKPEVRGEIALALEAVETTRELLRIRRRAEVDAETNYTLVQSLYEQGKAQFEDLAQASEVFFQAVTSTAVAKSNQTRAQLELQTLTGLTLQQIEEARRRYAVK